MLLPAHRFAPIALPSIVSSWRSKSFTAYESFHSSRNTWPALSTLQSFRKPENLAPCKHTTLVISKAENSLPFLWPTPACFPQLEFWILVLFTLLFWAWSDLGKLSARVRSWMIGLLQRGGPCLNRFASNCPLLQMKLSLNYKVYAPIWRISVAICFCLIWQRRRTSRTNLCPGSHRVD